MGVTLFDEHRRRREVAEAHRVDPRELAGAVDDDLIVERGAVIDDRL